MDSIFITETPLPDLEDITGRAFPEQDEEEDYATDCDEENDLEEEILDHGDQTEGSRKNSFLLVKKLILPEVLHNFLNICFFLHIKICKGAVQMAPRL